MGGCAVFDCHNHTMRTVSSEVLSYHSFPKQKALCQKWEAFCKRKGRFNVKTSHICNKHFERHCFDNYLEFEMGFAQRRNLKAGSVPTIYLNSTEESRLIAKKESKAIVEELLKQAEDGERKALETGHVSIDDEQSATSQEDEESVNLEEDEHPVSLHEVSKRSGSNRPDPLLPFKIIPYSPNSSEQPKLQQVETNLSIIEQISALKKHMSELTKANKELQLSEKRLKKEVEYLKSEHVKSEYHKNTLEEKLTGIFSKTQIKKLKNPLKRVVWSEEDMAKSITLYRTSPRAYKFLLESNFPFPSVRTIQHWSPKSVEALEVEILD